MTDPMIETPGDPTRRELEQALRAPALVARLSPVVAAGFGVLPIGEERKKLVVACFPRPVRAAMRVLARIVGQDVIARPCRTDLLHEMLEKAYFGPQRPTVNFPTFLDADFLERPDAAERLAVEKTERIGEAISTLPEWEVCFLDLDVRSEVKDIDAPRPTDPLPFSGGALDIAFRRRGDDGVIVFEPVRVARETFLVVQTWDFRDGRERREHGVALRAVSKLPHVIHPTEVQVVRLATDGTIELWLYDRFLQVAPGARPKLQLAYYYLSFGHRQRRELRIAIKDLFVVPRHGIERRKQPPWTARELARWLGV